MGDDTGRATAPAPAPAPLTVVAIGASAGGLDALKTFFAAASPDPRIVFVVVTHLPARRTSHLAELLDSAGPVRVSQAVDGEQLEAGRAYVAPPGVLVRLLAGALAFEPAEGSGSPHKPIDHFMLSIADAAAERGVGIVLSGTDKDGTIGLKAIRAAGGLAYVQAPDSAQFPGMPESAIAARAVDRTLTPREMPGALLGDLAHRPTFEIEGPVPTATDAATDTSLKEVLALVRERTGHDFGLYKPSMLRRRLARRMSLAGLADVADYLALLSGSPDEAQALKNEFLIGFTEFFRDREAWDELEHTVLPALLAEPRDARAPIRVWTPGCATGEETYSIAMLLLEQLDGVRNPPPIQVFGTDIDVDALATARAGSYPDSIEVSVPSRRLARFFEHVGGRYIVRQALRDAVLFAPQSLARDTPFSRLDLILCRNVLIYFEPALQQRVFELFHFALKPQGYLLLGRAESLGACAALFESASRAVRLFRRVGARTHLPRGFVGGWSGNLTTRAYRRRADDTPLPAGDLFDAHLASHPATAAVLVDREGRALQFRGEVSHFLDPRGDATLELARLVRQELRPCLRAALRRIAAAGEPSTSDTSLRHGATAQPVQVLVQAIGSYADRGLAAVRFLLAPSGDAAQLAPPPAPHADTADDLHQREFVVALEEAERSNEALRIANEEAQALNEELATVNAQLEGKIAEVARAKDDLDNLLESSQIATVLLDRELRVRRFTPDATQHFSLQRGDEGRLLSDISRRFEDADFAADLARVLATDQPSAAEVRTASGRSALRRILPYRAADGCTSGLVVTLVDVTALRDATRQARYLMTVLEDSNDALLVLGLDGAITDWNSGAARLYGFRREQAIASGLHAMVPAADRATTDAMLELVRRTGRFGPEVLRRRDRQGRIISVSVTASGLRDERGQVQAVLSTERDLTDQLRAQSEIYFWRLADRIPALLRVDDVAGRAQFVNQACVEYTGRPRETLLGHGWIEYLHPDDRARFEAEHLAGPHPRERHEIDLRLRRGDGTYRWMRSISVPHSDPEGRFAGYVALTMDVEERRKAEASLLNADRRKDEYVAMLAHELRNPLAPIRNAVAIMSRLGHLDAQMAWAVRIIDRQAGAMAKLLDDLLDVARIARGKVQIDHVPVELSLLVERALEASRPTMVARRHALKVEIAPLPLFVAGDLLRLTQVLVNLLNNAAKYTNEGGAIGLGLQRVGDEAVLEVTDNGIGIAPEMLPRVFDLFAQADTSLDRAQGGLGLGLTLVRQLVALHGGRVEAHREGLGRGSRFVVRLPLIEAPVYAPRQASLALPANPDDARRVLVVDDNIDAADSLAMVLRAAGHAVWVAYDGQAALAMAATNQPDVVILDIGLPGMDGYTVARGLRARQATAQCLLVALTGYGQPDDVARAREVGFDRHLVKPVDPAALLAIVAAVTPKTRAATAPPDGTPTSGAGPAPDDAH